MELYKIFLIVSVVILLLVWIVMVGFVLYGVVKFLFKTNFFPFKGTKQAVKNVYYPTAIYVRVPRICFKLMKFIIILVLLISVFIMLLNWEDLKRDSDLQKDSKKSTTFQSVALAEIPE